MSRIDDYLTDTLLTGAIAGVATTVAVAAAGEADQGEPLGPINSVSHILWGDEAATHDEASLKYTATGLGLNMAAVGSWAAVHELLFGDVSKKHLGAAIAAGAVVSGLAYVIDYHVVPRRLTPGFEKRVQPRSMLGIYATLAVALGVGSWLNRR